MHQFHLGNDGPLPAVAAAGNPFRTVRYCLRKTVLAVALVVAIRPVYPQAPRQPQTGFEVASIKPSDPSSTMKSMQIPLDDSRVTIRGLSLKQLMQYAWGNVGVGEGLHASLISGGPGWVDHDRFDVVAKPEGTRVPSRAERRQMLRELVVERFRLSFHHETRPTAVYALVVAKNGPKMKSRTPDDGGPPFSLPFISDLHITGRNVPMAALVDALQGILPLTDPEHDDRSIVDQTGLTGAFDLDLQWSGDTKFSGGRGRMSTETARAPELFTAIQEQLGLRLEPKKVPTEIIVIDHAEKPAAN
jgi:uncharacterized protein (TIGR03435 family)